MAGYKIVIRRDLESGATTWEPGCPLLVEAAQVSRDTDTGKAFLQARVRNVSAERITGYTVRFDVGYEGHEPEGLRASKLDADLAPGASVALKPIPLAHGDADSLGFTVESAKTPGGTWKSTSEPGSIPSAQIGNLSGAALEERVKLIDAMRLKNPDRAKASAVVDGDGWWACVCGAPNVGTGKCSVCDLRKKTAEQLCCEKSLQELAAKRKENELQASAKRRKARVLAIAGAIAAVLLAVILAAASLPGMKYDQAVSLYNEGKFYEAHAIFEEMPDYKNAQEWIVACEKPATYEHAIELYRNGEYAEALEAFESLGDYEHADHYIKLCYKKMGVEAPTEDTPPQAQPEIQQ